jgi:hypothetical protein
MTRKHTLMLAAAGTIAIAGTGAALAAGIRHSEPFVSAAGAPASYSSQRSGWSGGGSRGFFGARGPGFGLGFGLGGGLVQAAASYLGVSVSTLVGDLRAGQSLADVAGNTSGKSADGLVQTLVGDEKARLDKAVAAGRLSQAQEDELTANLQQRIRAFVDAKPPAVPAAPPRGRGFGLPGFGFGFGGGRHGGWGTPPSSGGATA